MNIIALTTITGRATSLIFCILVMGLSASCANSKSSPQLSEALAVRAADKEVLRVMKIDLRQFARPTAKYFDGEKCWYVSYRRDSRKYAEFTVKVNDRTKKAIISMP